MYIGRGECVAGDIGSVLLRYLSIVGLARGCIVNKVVFCPVG